MKARHVLGTAAVLIAVAATFQAVISFVPDWSADFGAPENLLRNPIALIAAGIGVAAVLCVGAVYAASGAGYIRPLPARRLVLLGAGSVFAARGLVLLPVFLRLGGPEASDWNPSAEISSSAFALIIGTLLLAGTIMRWNELK